MIQVETKYNKIIDLIQTKTQAENFLNQIDLFLSALFEIKDTIAFKMSDYFPHQYNIGIIEAMEKENVNTNDVESVQTFMEGLKESIKSVKVITLRVAFDPKDSNVRTIYSWFIGNLGKKLFLDIIVDRTLVGGVTFDLDGVYKDYSLRKRLEEKFKKGEVRSLLKEI